MVASYEPCEHCWRSRRAMDLAGRATRNFAGIGWKALSTRDDWMQLSCAACFIAWKPSCDLP